MKKQTKPLTNKAGDARPLTKADARLFRRARDVDPELVAAYETGTIRARGRPKKFEKKAISLRVRADTLAFFKSKGEGWQTRINAILDSIADAAR